MERKEPQAPAAGTCGTARSRQTEAVTYRSLHVRKANGQTNWFYLPSTRTLYQRRSVSHLLGIRAPVYTLLQSVRKLNGVTSTTYTEESVSGSSTVTKLSDSRVKLRAYCLQFLNFNEVEKTPSLPLQKWNRFSKSLNTKELKWNVHFSLL